MKINGITIRFARKSESITLQHMWTNFHTHSSYCDGKGELSSFTAKAIELNMRTLGFSSHAPLPFDCKWCMKKELLPTYLTEIKKLRDQHPELEFYTGLESDYIPEIVSPAQFKPQLDYVIGSIHFVEQFPDGTPWEIDGLHHNFLQGLEKIFNNNIREAVCRYYELTREMISKGKPDVVGHLDKVKIQNIDEKFFPENESWYQQEVLKTIDTIEEAGIIVEVNTRGIYQRKSATTYPSPWILEILHQRNIPVMINSDAHHPDDLINQFSETSVLVNKIGFKKISTLHEGIWKQYNYTSNGITFN